MNIFKSCYTELIKPVWTLWSTPIYAIMYNYKIMNFSKFLKLIQYKEILSDKHIDYFMCPYSYNEKRIENGLCKFSNPCEKFHCPLICKISHIDFKQVYETLTIEELKEIWLKVREEGFKSKSIWVGSYGNRARGFNVYGCDRYKSKIFSIFSSIVSKYLKNVSEKQKLEFEEKKKFEEERKETGLEDSRKNARTKVIIINVKRSHNPFEFNAKSIRIEYKLVNTNEEFADYITYSTKPYLEYKTARLQIATETTDMENIFDDNFDKFKQTIIGKTIFIDIKRENGKISLDGYIGAMFYKE